jgi:hypothetical protein
VVIRDDYMIGYWPLPEPERNAWRPPGYEAPTDDFGRASGELAAYAFHVLRAPRVRERTAQAPYPRLRQLLAAAGGWGSASSRAEQLRDGPTPQDTRLEHPSRSTKRATVSASRCCVHRLNPPRRRQSAQRPRLWCRCCLPPALSGPGRLAYHRTPGSALTGGAAVVAVVRSGRSSGAAIAGRSIRRTAAPMTGKMA